MRVGKLLNNSYYTILTPSKNSTQNIEELLYQSIQKRLDTDASTAALLSGGIDSAMICAIAKAQGKNLPTFTLGYDEYTGYDERS